MFQQSRILPLRFSLPLPLSLGFDHQLKSQKAFSPGCFQDSATQSLRLEGRQRISSCALRKIMVFLVRLAALLFALVLAEGLAVGHPHGAATVLRLRGAGKNKAAGGNTEGKRSGEEPILCRLKKGGSKWEVACRANKVEAFKEGKIKKSELLLFEEPFQDFKKGDRPSGASIEAAFGTTECGPQLKPLAVDT